MTDFLTPSLSYNTLIILTTGSAPKFSDAFNSSSINAIKYPRDPDALLSSFNDQCPFILDKIAQIKTENKNRITSWLNPPPPPHPPPKPIKAENMNNDQCYQKLVKHLRLSCPFHFLQWKLPWTFCWNIQPLPFFTLPRLIMPHLPIFKQLQFHCYWNEICSSSCSLDIVTKRLLKEVFSTVNPVILRWPLVHFQIILNILLFTGCYSH